MQSQAPFTQHGRRPIIGRCIVSKGVGDGLPSLRRRVMLRVKGTGAGGVLCLPRRVWRLRRAYAAKLVSRQGEEGWRGLIYCARPRLGFACGGVRSGPDGLPDVVEVCPTPMPVEGKDRLSGFGPFFSPSFLISAHNARRRPCQMLIQAHDSQNGQVPALCGEPAHPCRAWLGGSPGADI